MTQIQRVPTTNVEFEKYVHDSASKIYIFGADIAGKIILKIMRAKGIDIEGFIDNNKNKCGIPIDGVPVLHASSLLGNIPKKATFLIASTYISDIIIQLEDLGYYQWCPIVNFIRENDFSYYQNMLEGDLRKNHSGGEFTKDFDIFVLQNMTNSQEKYLDKNILFIRSVDLILTEKCSLKCVDCSNLMQYYEKPVDISFDELTQNLDDLCSAADEINEIRIIGGDPLMNKDFHKAISYASKKKNVNKVVVYTNGTICPSEEKIAAIAHPKVFVFITTYGDLSKKTEPLKKLLGKYGIPSNMQPAYGWTDCADIKHQSRTDIELENTFKNCCAKHFTTMTMGRIFRCPYSANVERLAAIPDNPDDYININGFENLELNEKAIKKQQLWDFLRNKTFIQACDHCNGRTYGDPEIKPGIQTKKILQYIKYERV
jgi:MoaA/NifB/PqqE/SkfB family radical SAM enzyme